MFFRMGDTHQPCSLPLLTTGVRNRAAWPWPTDRWAGGDRGDRTGGPSKRTSTACANELVARWYGWPSSESSLSWSKKIRKQSLGEIEKGQVPARELYVASCDFVLIFYVSSVAISSNDIFSSGFGAQSFTLPLWNPAPWSCIEEDNRRTLLLKLDGLRDCDPLKVGHDHSKNSLGDVSAAISGCSDKFR